MREKHATKIFERDAERGKEQAGGDRQSKPPGERKMWGKGREGGTMKISIFGRSVRPTPWPAKGREETEEEEEGTATTKHLFLPLSYRR